jgi:hypothetical protein
MTFLDDYTRGFEVLSISAEVFARLSQSIGQPMPNKDIPTARVSFDPEKKVIHFEMNPDYISKLSDEEVGAVISHETYHVLLNHFADLPDRKKYPNLQALIQAQECIINDGLFGNVGLELPDGVLSGPVIHQQDFSLFSTKEGYDFIVGDEPPAEESGQGQDSSQNSSSGSGSDSSSSGNSSSSESEDTSDENESSNGSSSDETSDTEDDSKDGSKDNEKPQDSKADSDDSKGDSQKEESDSGDSDSDDADGSSESDSSGSEGDEDSKDDSPADHMCGGMEIRDEDLQAFKDAVSDAINSAMSGVSPDEVPTSVTDTIEAISHEEGMSINPSGWSVGPVDKSTEFLTQSHSGLDLKWEDLLARINPKIKSTGRPRERESWHAPRRKMIGSYPEIILPTYRRKENPENKGDSVPMVILALDMSYSIPEYLIKKLASLADSIPSDIIKPHPVTWSNSVLFFDTTARRIVKRSGTNIDNVYDYADKIEKDTKTKPYVLVITDGDCKFGGSDYSLPSRMDRKRVAERWFWMATEPSKVSLIRKNFGSYSPEKNIYSIADFM